MLENARRQLVLVLFTVLAAILVGVLIPPNLGTDLKGGTLLIYEIPADVLTKLQEQDPEATPERTMEQTVTVIRERIDPTGVLDALVARRGPAGILIELPDMEAAQLAIVEERIASLGKLEMRIVASDDAPHTDVRFNTAEEKKRLEKWLNEQGGRELVLESWKNIDRFNGTPTDQGGPLAYGKLKWYPHLITPSTRSEANWDYSFAKAPQAAMPAVAAFQDAEWNQGVIPPGLEKKELLEFLAIDMHEVFFTGEDLDAGGVAAGSGRDGGPAVNYKIKAERSGEYADWSEKYINKHSAIILNNLVRSAPRFESRIPGQGQIHGSFTVEEVNELVKVLRTGSLRVEPEFQSRQVIGPTLGARSVQLGLISLLAGALAVFGFMLMYYRLAGIVACVTLVLNVTLLYAAMLISQATLTLPGLGGFVLTMGMAVDANILIYERIREELSKGKDLLRGVRAGFDRAMVTILDANITTFLTGMVLFSVGVGPVRGFAVTLMWGIVTTVFTQFFVTRLLFHYLLNWKMLREYRARSWFSGLQFNFVGYIRRCVVISTIVIVAGVSYAAFGVPREVLLGLDFTGGANLQMVLERPVAAQQIKDALRDVEFARQFSTPLVNTVGGTDAQGRAETFNLRLKLTDSLRQQIEAERREWRQRKDEALAQGQPAPPDYLPPYLAHLKRIFAEDLVPPAFSDARVAELPGGTHVSAQIALHFQRPVSLPAVLERLQQVRLQDVEVKALDEAGTPQAGVAESRNVFVEWTALSTTKTYELFPIVRDALGDFKDVTGQSLLLSNPFPEAEEIGGRMVGELRNAAIGALILSWALIIFYLRVRFHEYKYGIAAVIALIHDVLVTLGVIALCNHLEWVNAELNLNMIAAFLTIVGYSVNDTIVVFDRIRENLAEQARLGDREPYDRLINRSINQTLSRTILTTGVTIFVVLAQFLVNWGSGSLLESFAFAMLVGMVSGTYSTVYIAAPILIWMRGREQAGTAGPGEVEKPEPQPVAAG